MKIISVSRRTDVAGFYSEWFMNRVRAGCVSWANPFSGVKYDVSLRPEDVMAFVFWSKNYIPLLPYLDELDTREHKMVFHFTITGLPKVVEPRVPEAAELVDCARALARRYGPDAVLWRYDPILISSITDRDYHLRRFRELCAALEGSVRRCYFSFAVFYQKVLKNSDALRRQEGIVCHDLPTEERVAMANALAGIAQAHGIEMFTCCGDYLISGAIKKAHCVDAELLRQLYPERIGRLTKLPTRQDCGCCQCTDIGAYDTCPHGCVYCYANTRPEVATRNHRQHDPYSPILGRPSRPEAPPRETQRELDLRL